jgi:hypothetical protein
MLQRHWFLDWNKVHLHVRFGVTKSHREIAFRFVALLSVNAYNTPALFGTSDKCYILFTAVIYEQS